MVDKAPALAGLLQEVSSDTVTAADLASTPSQVCGTAPHLVFDMAGIFDDDSKEPTDPFTLYGTNRKKYAIEQLQGEKIIARKKGFTVTTCVGAVPAAEESPQFQGLPVAGKLDQAGNQTCRSAEGIELKPTCGSSCRNACTAGFDAYVQANKDFSGYVIDSKDQARVLKSCIRQCTYECGKPGKVFDFAVPFRR
ncbi:hypothetical protein WJX72_003300 [[Myrmecia] bisecta]|uniref:Uncharacterized protein n=1 Tax=[Myrmecia] bisecta TaxID=41462 RepID=A0AAW1QEL5_9CHLO